MPIRPNEDVEAAERRRNTAGKLALAVTVMVALATLTPYVWDIPAQNMQLITQAQTTLYNGWMLVLAYYYKTRENNPVDAQTISTQAATIKQAQDKLAPVVEKEGDNPTVRPGENITVEGVNK